MADDDSDSWGGSPPHYVDELENDDFARQQREARNEAISQPAVPLDVDRYSSAPVELGPEDYEGPYEMEPNGDEDDAETEALYASLQAEQKLLLQQQQQQQRHMPPPSSSSSSRNPPSSSSSSSNNNYYPASSSSRTISSSSSNNHANLDEIAPSSSALQSSSASSAAAAAAANSADKKQLEVARSFAAKLSEKVQQQARDLQKLTSQLQNTESYAKMCESKISELAPDILLPLSEVDFNKKGRPLNISALGASSLASKSAASTSRPLSASSSSSASAVQAAANAASTPTFMLSENARLVRENKELVNAASRIERELKATSAKLTEHIKLNKDLKAASEAKERDIQSLIRKSERMAQQLSELEALQKTSTEYTSKLERKLATAPASKQQASVLRQNSDLQQQLTNLESERRQFIEQIRAEQTASEEQRAFIDVLKSALESKARDLGIGEGKGKVLIELAELRGKCDRFRKEIMSKDELNKTLDSDLTAARTRVHEVEEQLSTVLEQFNATETELKKYQNESGGLHHELEKLSNDKMALLDHAQDSMDITKRLESDIAKLQAQLDATQSENGDLRNKLDEADGLLDRLKDELYSVSKDRDSTFEQLQAAQSKIHTLEAQKSAAEQLAQDKIQEYEELSAIQIELLNAIRDAKQDADALKHETDKATEEAARLRKDNERTHVLVTTLQDRVVDMDAKHATQIRNLESEISARELKLRSLESDLDRSNKERESTSAELSVALQNLEELHREVESISDEYSTVRAGLEDSMKESASYSTQLRRSEMELEALRERFAAQEAATATAESELMTSRDNAYALQSEVERITAINGSLEVELSASRSQLADVREEAKKDQSERAMERRLLYDQIHTLRTEIESLRSSREEVLTRSVQSQERTEREVSSKESEIRSLSEQLHSCREQRDEAKSQLAHLQSQVTSLSSEKTSLSHSVHDLKKQLDDLKHSSFDHKQSQSNEIARLGAQLAEVMQENTIKSGLLRDRDDELSKLKSAMERAAADVSLATLEHKVLLGRIQHLENEKASLQQELSDAQMSHFDAAAADSNARDLDELRAQAEAMHQQAMTTQIQVEAERQELHSRLESAQSHIRILMTQLHQQQQQQQQQQQVASASSTPVRSQNKSPSRSKSPVRSPVRSASSSANASRLSSPPQSNRSSHSIHILEQQPLSVLLAEVEAEQAREENAQEEAEISRLSQRGNAFASFSSSSRPNTYSSSSYSSALSSAPSSSSSSFSASLLSSSSPDVQSAPLNSFSLQIPEEQVRAVSPLKERMMRDFEPLQNPNGEGALLSPTSLAVGRSPTQLVRDLKKRRNDLAASSSSVNESSSSAFNASSLSAAPSSMSSSSILGESSSSAASLEDKLAKIRMRFGKLRQVSGL